MELLYQRGRREGVGAHGTQVHLLLTSSDHSISWDENLNRDVRVVRDA